MNTPRINRERLAATFTTLCEISSPSKRERDLADYLRQCFTDLGADEIFEDDSSGATGSNCGNLIIRFHGNSEAEGVFFACHMDTVEPGDNVKVVYEDGVFYSAGETVLGGDDKSGIAALLETMMVIRENKLAHGLIEIVLTTCEEIGLLGAKNLDYNKISAPYGYALDATGIDTVIIGAPAANKLKIEIYGVAAHAGINPEQGVSAIQAAAQGINALNLGRIDQETTANIGIVAGGVATNIVPAQVTLHGEIRSHSQKKLEQYTTTIQNSFTEAVATWNKATVSQDPELKATSSFEIEAEYPAMHLEEEAPVLRRIQRAAKHTEKGLSYIITGGGSDANIMNNRGLPTAIVATGMDKVHTVDEQLKLDDLCSVTELVLALSINTSQP
ncbi:MAG: peptidase M20 [Deltaproteobacteria bacterium]|nr:MAG: peptidase M20 [Deltaproteobacteria bacterium]